MTAAEFVAAIRRAAKGDAGKRESTRAWMQIRRRKTQAFKPPADPVIQLLARYDLSGVTFGQFGFLDNRVPDGDGLWHVATKSTDDYYIIGGQLLKMYYKEAFPGDTGLTSGQFLETLVVYAQMIAAMHEDGINADDPRFAEYAARAAAVSPDAQCLDWFLESHRRRSEARRAAGLIEGQ